MKSSRAAIRYAKALLLESVEKKNIEEVYNDMLIVKETFTNNIDLRHMIDSLVIKNSIKKRKTFYCSNYGRRTDNTS